MSRASRRESRVFQGIGVADLGELLAVFEAKHLHDEFDVDDAAEAAFQIAVTAAGLDALAHLQDFRAQRRLPFQIVGRLADRGHDFHAEVGIAEDDAARVRAWRSQSRSAAVVVVLLELAERNHQAARFARVGLRAHVDVVEAAHHPGDSWPP